MFVGYTGILPALNVGGSLVRDPLVLLAIGAVIGGAVTRYYYGVAGREAREQYERARFQQRLQAHANEHADRGGSYEYIRDPDGELMGVILESPSAPDEPASTDAARVTAPL